MGWVCGTPQLLQYEWIKASILNPLISSELMIMPLHQVNILREKAVVTIMLLAVMKILQPGPLKNFKTGLINRLFFQNLEMETELTNALIIRVSILILCRQASPEYVVLICGRVQSLTRVFFILQLLEHKIT